MRRILIVALLALLISCGPSSDRSTPPSAGRRAGPERSLAATIAGVSDANGATLVELPLGSRDGIEPGLLLRVTDAANAERLKGTLQVTELLGADRCIARLIALFDRNIPLAIGDRVEEVRDLTALADPQAIAEVARQDHEQARAQEQREDEAFQKLRTKYQEELKRVQEACNSKVEEVDKRQAQRIDELTQTHRRELERRDSVREADLAALRATLTEEAGAALRTARTQADADRRALVAERTRLADQVPGLLAQQEELKAAIRRLIAEENDLKARHREEIRAEVETRELLRNRVKELEARSAGVDKPLAPVLANDPDRGETVLEQLRRSLAANQEAAVRLREMEGQNAELDAGYQEALAEIDALTAQRGAAEAQQNDQRLAALTARLAELREHAAAQELARLQAERSYYELARRILASRDDPAALKNLQERLREALAGQQAGGGGGQASAPKAGSP